MPAAPSLNPQFLRTKPSHVKKTQTLLTKPYPLDSRAFFNLQPSKPESGHANLITGISVPADFGLLNAFDMEPQIYGAKDGP